MQSCLQFYLKKKSSASSTSAKPGAEKQVAEKYHLVHLFLSLSGIDVAVDSLDDPVSTYLFCMSSLSSLTSGMPDHY